LSSLFSSLPFRPLPLSPLLASRRGNRQEQVSGSACHPNFVPALSPRTFTSPSAIAPIAIAVAIALMVCHTAPPRWLSPLRCRTRAHDITLAVFELATSRALTLTPSHFRALAPSLSCSHTLMLALAPHRPCPRPLVSYFHVAPTPLSPWPLQSP
jgi:hypothetical protein